MGQPTRGKTARNRLRRVDIFLTRYDPNLIRRTDGEFRHACFVDLGYGAEPITTLESAERFSKLNPTLATLGIEIDPDRVSEAIPHQTDHIHFRYGGFNLPLYGNETVRLVRAFNVLRQYSPDQVKEAIHTLAGSILDGGLIIEGTSDPWGRVWTANLIRVGAEGSTDYEAIVFNMSLRHGFDPADLQRVLPKNLINKMGSPTKINKFMKAWKDASLHTISYKEISIQKWFAVAAEQLAQAGYQIDLRKKILKSGFLIWKYPDLEY